MGFLTTLNVLFQLSAIFHPIPRMIESNTKLSVSGSMLGHF